MAMIPMKRLQVVVPEALRDNLLKALMALECVEISEPEDSDPEWAQLLIHKDSPPTDTLESLNAVKTALIALDRFCKAEKSRFFPELRSITLQELDNQDLINRTIEKARFLNRLSEDIDLCHAEEERILTRKLALAPWQSMDIPLDAKSSERVSIHFGVCPGATELLAMAERLKEEAPEALMMAISSDKEQSYLVLLNHHSRESEVESLLKDFGFSPVTFKGYHGTALANMGDLDRQIAKINEKRTALEEKFEGLKYFRDDLEFCFDAMTQRVRQEEIRSRLLHTSRTLFMEGWVPENRIDPVARELNALGCAYRFSEPRDQDEPPVAFQNAPVAAPFGIISALYGTPRYRSIVDPTPFMAPFFFIFFGIMVSDVAYGMILALTAIWVLRQQKQTGFIRQLFILVLYCGVSTMIWGLLFGSWFGDMIPAVSKMLTGTPVFIRPIWFDPLKQPMDMLVFSFALGGLQILTGLGLSAWRKIRSGQWLDAIFDVGFWYMILIGLVMGLVKLPYGLELAGAGAAGVVLTAGRNEKNPFKRIITGILSLYSVTGYLADVLSYSRLLALGLASSVIASVINAMGTIGGRSVGGIIGLVVIFIFGHLFNLAINLVGAYVHASRLQYVEFFSKFYDGGGRPFKPFGMDTKYVQVEKNGYDH